MEGLQKIGYIALTNPNGTIQLGVPIYIKVKELNEHGTTDQQEKFVHEATKIMLEHYEDQISNFMAALKETKSNKEVTDNA